MEAGSCHTLGVFLLEKFCPIFEEVSLNLLEQKCYVLHLVINILDQVHPHIQVQTD